MEEGNGEKGEGRKRKMEEEIKRSEKIKEKHKKKWKTEN